MTIGEIIELKIGCPDGPSGRKTTIIRSINPYFSKATSHFWLDSGGSKLRNIFEPSNGGIGIRLKIAKEMLIKTKT